jgi:hypothetical protein
MSLGSLEKMHANGLAHDYRLCANTTFTLNYYAKSSFWDSNFYEQIMGT